MERSLDWRKSLLFSTRQVISPNNIDVICTERVVDIWDGCYLQAVC